MNERRHYLENLVLNFTRLVFCIRQNSPETAELERLEEKAESQDICHMKIMEVSILLAFELIFVDGELGLESNFCSLVAREHFIGRLHTIT